MAHHYLRARRGRGRCGERKRGHWEPPPPALQAEGGRWQVSTEAQSLARAQAGGTDGDGGGQAQGRTPIPVHPGGMAPRRCGTVLSTRSKTFALEDHEVTRTDNLGAPDAESKAHEGLTCTPWTPPRGGVFTKRPNDEHLGGP